LAHYQCFKETNESVVIGYMTIVEPWQ